VVAIYTLAQYPEGQPGPQTQNIAYSLDGGYSFIPYSENPVIPSTSSQFRDPKVVWYQDHWVVVISYAQDFTVGFYTSPDLKSWTHTSNFSHRGLLGLQYECPNLVEMPVEGTSDTLWVLQISINPGAPLGGSISQYFPGTFNGTHFTTIDDVARIADFGKDNYAGQFFSGIPSGSDAISIAWASNWQYCQLVPTGPQEGWRSSMSLPRRNFLTNITRVGMVMASAPYDLSPVLGDALASNSSLGNGSIIVDYSGVPSNAVYLSINATNVNPSLLGTDSTVNFTFCSPVSNEYLRGGFFFGGDQHFFLDRGGTHGFENPFFTDKISTTDVIGSNGAWSVEVLIDRSIIEVFLDGGTRSATQTFFPTTPLTILAVSAGGMKYGMEISIQVRAVLSAWAQYEDGTGYVVGNLSSATGGKLKKRSVSFKA
jgi:beta-fructofuranosidase